MNNRNKPVKSRIRPSRFVSFAYVMPLAAVIIAAWLVWRAIPVKGPEIILQASEAEAISPGRTMVRFRGIDVGEVTDVQLADNYNTVNIHIELEENQEKFARSGARFWIVKPEVRLGQVSGLNTIISGRYIAAEPGDGKPVKIFQVLEEIPVAGLAEGDLQIELFSAYAGSVSKGANIFFRDMEIGVVHDVGLSTDSSYVSVDAVIYNKYARLVRSNSVFWKGQGLDIDISLLKGISFDMGNFQSLLSSKIMMGTPNQYGERAEDGRVYTLHEKPEKEWLLWNAKIPAEPETDVEVLPP